MPDANITKSALARSMKRLMSEKAFAKISVTDICDECGMNRKSFYYHFKDKYDLMNWIFYTEFIGLITKGGFEDGWGLMESVCELFYKDQEFYKNALATEGQNSFSEYLSESIEPIVLYLSDDRFGDAEQNKMMVPLFCDVCIAAVTNWLQKGCRVTPKEYISLIKKMIAALSTNLS